MLTQFEIWSFKTPKYRFKWYVEPNERTQDFTSTLSVRDKDNLEIYRKQELRCTFGSPPVDGGQNQGLPFYAMVREAINYLRSK